ncbi:hypothetical protein NC652_036198 [Populus alba x Populus x berolinensis]|nr:hypothetical protein NC652_036198 [Populus alba x Populus x berolinensis]
MPSNFSPPLGLSYFSLKTNDPHNSKKLTRKIFPVGWRNKAVTGRFVGVMTAAERSLCLVISPLLCLSGLPILL